MSDYQNTDDILLEQRPPSGIWGGLWSLPECTAEQANDSGKKDTEKIIGQGRFRIHNLEA